MKQNGIQLLGANEIASCKGRKNLCRDSGTAESNRTGVSLDQRMCRFQVARALNPRTNLFLFKGYPQIKQGIPGCAGSR